MVRCRLIGAVVLLVVTGAMVPTSSALEPPTKEQIERYRRDGTLAERAVAARKLDNHRVAPELAQRLVGRAEAVKNIEISKVLPSTGNRRVFALLIDFEDHGGQNPRSDFDASAPTKASASTIGGHPTGSWTSMERPLPGTPTLTLATASKRRRQEERT